MARETGARRYRDLIRRFGVRIVKENLKRGPAANLLGWVVDEERRSAAEDAQAIESLRLAMAAADTLADSLDVTSNRLLEATLLAAGYRRPNNSRRRQVMTGTTNLIIADTGQSDDGRSLDELMARARAGDASAIPPLRAELDAPGLWTGPGDLAAVAEASWIALITSEAAFAEALTRRAATMRVEIEGASPTPLESILARRVVVAWLMAYYADALCAQVAAGRTRQQEGLLIARSEQAARRLTAAVAALESLRKSIGAGIRPGATRQSAPGPTGDRTRSMSRLA